MKTDLQPRCGIYKIVNKIDGKYYVGSSKHIYKRWRKHKSLLRHNKHLNDYLQNAFNLYGFAKANGYDASDEELISIIRRIEGQGNGTLEFNELK